MNLLRIKEILDEKGLSIKEFAKRSGLSYTYCTEIIRGDKFPRPETLYNIATSLDVDIRDLFNPTKNGEKSANELIFDIEKSISELKNKV